MSANGKINFQGHSYDVEKFRSESRNLSSDEQFIKNIFREIKSINNSPTLSSPTRKTSSNSDKTSDIDMSQYELCNSPSSDENVEFISLTETTVQDLAPDEKVKEGSSSEVTETSSSLASIFSFLKNSFKGKDEKLSKKVENVPLESKDVNLLSSKESAKVDKQNLLCDLGEVKCDGINDWNKNNNKDEKLCVDKRGTELIKDNQPDSVNLESSSSSEKNDSFKLFMDVCQAKTSEEKLKAEENLRDAVCKRYEYFSQISDQNNFVKIENILSSNVEANPFEFLNELVSKPYDQFGQNVTQSEIEDKPIDILPADRSFKNDLSKTSTKDSETNTTAYDFNVSYIGGVSEPGYRVIDAYNRGINTPSPIDNTSVSPLPMKFSLDKSTMTNSTSVIYEGTMFNIHDDPVEEDRTEDLKRMFPKVPVCYLKNLYINLCKNDFDYAVDHLRSIGDVGGDFGIMNLEEEAAAVVAPIEQALSPERPKSSNKREKSNNTDQDKLMLQREFEKKFIIDEKAYDSHVLKIKKLRNREVDELQAETVEENFMKFENEMISDLNDMALTDDNFAMNENDEREEILELNLGEKFIKELEKAFGCADYEIPHGISPKIQIRKSMAQELHALWIESLHQQLETKQRELEEMIQKGN